MTSFTAFPGFVRRLLSALALSVLCAGAVHAAPILTVVDWKLTGATGVQVGTGLYDVEFKDGTCIALFSGCDELSDFVFQNDSDARLAASALLDFVFVNTSAGEFDDWSFLTRGCLSNSSCSFVTPFAFSEELKFVLVAGAWNNSVDFGVRDNVFGTGFDPSAPVRPFLWAVWSPSSPVPEPSTLALLGLAGVALGWSQRRRRLRASALAQ